MSLDGEIDHFLEYLLNNKDLMQFIKYEKQYVPEDLSIRRQKILDLRNRITTFYNYQLLGSRPQMPCFYTPDRHLSRHSLQLAHLHFYLQWKLYRLRSKSLHYAIEKADVLLTELEIANDVDDPKSIIIDEPALYAYLLADPEKASRLISKDSQIVNIISIEDLIAPDIQTQTGILQQILYTIRPQFDRRAMFVRNHPLQDKFEQLLFLPQFIFRRQVDNLIQTELQKPSDMQSFTPAVVKLMQTILKEMGISDAIDISIFSIIFFRAMFDYAVSIDKNYFRKSFPTEFRNASPRITLENTGASPELLPNIPSTVPLLSIPQSNPDLIAAKDYLTTLAFLNSPLDILGTIHEALSAVRNFTACASTEGGDAAQSFDSVFGVFLVALVYSDLANVEEVFWFANTFAPMDGLSGPLEYARATASAVLMQCATMLKFVN